jgi:hypothetical protein
VSEYGNIIYGYDDHRFDFLRGIFLFYNQTIINPIPIYDFAKYIDTEGITLELNKIMSTASYKNIFNWCAQARTVENELDNHIDYLFGRHSGIVKQYAGLIGGGNGYVTTNKRHSGIVKQYAGLIGGGNGYVTTNKRYKFKYVC